jgi:hypothetical protein
MPELEIAVELADDFLSTLSRRRVNRGVSSDGAIALYATGRAVAHQSSAGVKFHN